MKPRKLSAPLCVLLVAAGVATPLFAAAQAADPAPVASENTARHPADGPWRAPGGGMLPFASAAEAIDFLATAEIVERKEIEGTYGRPSRFTLEKDGVRARAIFRTVDVAGLSTNQKSDHRLMLRDNYRFEVAAWELSRLLGIDNIPPTTLRTVDGKEGSIQLWVEEASNLEKLLEGGAELAQPQLYALQRHELLVFDALILNFDRNAGNQLLDADGKLWYVDHTRTFMRVGDLKDADQLLFCDRRLWNGLQALDRDAVKAALAPYLEPAQIEALFKRHKLLVRRLEKLIAEKGEDGVLFEIVRTRPTA